MWVEFKTIDVEDDMIRASTRHATRWRGGVGTATKLTEEVLILLRDVACPWGRRRARAKQGGVLLL